MRSRSLESKVLLASILAALGAAPVGAVEPAAPASPAAKPPAAVPAPAAEPPLPVPGPRVGDIPPLLFANFFGEIQEDTVVVDVRSPEEFKAAAVAGAVNVPADQLDAHLDRLPKDKRIVTYCDTGVRAEAVYRALKAKGYPRVGYLRGRVVFVNGVPQAKGPVPPTAPPAKSAGG